MTELQLIGSALKSAIEAAGGLENSLDQGAALYSGVYRYPAQKASELVLECGVSIKAIAEDIHRRLVQAQYEAELGLVSTTDMDESESLQFDYELEDFKESLDMPMPIVTEDTMVSCLCNYKGEEADIGEFALDSEPIPIFYGKYDYR